MLTYKFIIATNIVTFLLLGTLVTPITTAINTSAEKIEGTDDPELIVGTPEDDNIDSKGGDDTNAGDSVIDGCFPAG